MLELVVQFDRERHKRLGQQGRKGKLVHHVGTTGHGLRPQPDTTGNCPTAGMGANNGQYIGHVQLHPSMAISRRFPSHAPGVAATASGTATRSIHLQWCFTQSRACEIAPVMGTNHSLCGSANRPNPSVSRTLLPFTDNAEDNG